MAATAQQSGSDGTIATEYRESGGLRVAVIRLQCGENRINPIFSQRLLAALDRVEGDASVKALVITGEAKFFSNGVDLKWLSQVPASDVNKTKDAFSTLVQRLLVYPLPTVAAINGHAFAGGAAMSLATDYRVMQRGRGWFCLNEVHIGLPFGTGTREMIKSRLSGAVFNEALVLGRRFTGEQAFERGIVQRLAEPGEVVEASLEMLAQVLPPEGIGRTYLGDMKKATYADIMEKLEKPEPNVLGRYMSKV